MLEEKLKMLRTLKKDATMLRNLNEFDEALEILDKVISKLNKILNENNVDLLDTAKIHAELADTWGMKGGIYRRKVPPKKEKALNAYKEGRKIEQKYDKSTYNLTNMISLSIELGKASPIDPDMRNDLQKAITSLEKETQGSRVDEWWAWSDLGQFYLLLDKMEAAIRCYERAHKTGPTKGEYKRHISILKELVESIEKKAPKIAKNINALIEKLSKFT